MRILKKSLIVISLLVVSILLFNSCEKEISKDSIIESKSIVLDKKNTFNELFTFPVGTKLDIKGEKIEFELSDGYEMIMQVVDKDGKISVKRVMMGSVTCTCTEGSGCNPYIIGDQSGCSTEGGCTRCIMETGKVSNNGDIYELLDAQVVKFNQDIQFLLDEKDYQMLETPKAFIFNDEKVLSYLDKFLSIYNNTDDGLAQKKLSLKSKSDVFVNVPTNFLGLQVISTLNKKKCSLTAELLDAKVMLGGYSCSCSEGNGCTYGKTWTPKGTLHYCEAEGCTSCTLSDG